MDLFATRDNAQLPKFVSPVPDQTALAVDAMSLKWEFRLAYAFPPTPLLPAVLRKIKEDKATVILVSTVRWSKSWISTYLELLRAAPRYLPCRKDLLTQPRSRTHHQNLQGLNLHVAILSGDPLYPKDGTLWLWTQSGKERGPPL